MIDKEKIVSVFDGLRPFTDTDIHPIVSPDNWLAYSNLRDVIDVAEENIVDLLKEQETKWIHREDMDFIDKYKRTHFHGMCTNCGFVHDFIDGHTGQYKYCPQCGRLVKWEW